MSKNPYWDTPSGVLKHKLMEGGLTKQEAAWAKEVLDAWMNDGYGPPKHWLDD